MEWPVMVALILAVPVVIFSMVFVWRLNLGGVQQSAGAPVLAEPMSEEERCRR